MKKLPISLAILSLSLVWGLTFQSRGQDSPNVILMMADDLGWGDVQCFNPKTKIKTPELDAMAAAGMQFNRFYSSSPVCSPTRGSCVTGRHPFRYGFPLPTQGE